MQHLSGQDNLFLGIEKTGTPMHVASMGIYDPSTAPGGKVRFKTVLDYFKAKTYEMDFFRRRIVSAPMGLDRPYWVDEGDVDVEFHVRHISLPAPGDWRQLMIQLARLHARPLDTSRPLWEAYVIEGLDNIEGIAKGSFAVYIKMHHAGVDGQVGAMLIQILHSLTPEYDSAPKQQVVYADQDPSDSELVIRGIINRGKQVIDAAKLTALVTTRVSDLNDKYGAELVEHIQKVVGAGLNKTDEPKTTLLPGNTQTRFDGKLSPHRVVDAFGLPLAECAVIRKNIPGVTINDIFIAITGGGVRKYLTAHHDLPDVAMNAMMPLAITGKARNPKSANNVSMAAVSMHTNIADPIERLLEVKKSAGKAKRQQVDIGLDLAPKLMDVVPFAVSKKLLYSMVFNNSSVTISNVRGPDVPLYLAGAKMQMFMPVSIPFDGVGLNVTGFSYDGTLWVCIVACREMLPDPGFMAQCLRESFDELLKDSEKWGKKTKVNTEKNPVKKSTAPKSKKPLAKAAAVKKAVSRKSS